MHVSMNSFSVFNTASLFYLGLARETVRCFSFQMSRRQHNTVVGYMLPAIYEFSRTALEYAECLECLSILTNITGSYLSHVIAAAT
jgi:uncharacterized protein YaiE (UPF0345 family)